MTDLERRLQKCLESEEQARHEAEELLAAKTAELHQANQGLQAAVAQQEELVHQRTEDLRYALELAETANKHKSFFLANMSHEIRTPLNGIIGLTQLLQANNLDASQQKSYIDKIQLSANNLLLIVNDILDFSSIDSKHLRLEQLVFDLDSILRNIFEMNHINASIKKIDFSVLGDFNIPAALVGDPARLTQVINNLVSNAVKFTLEGSVKVEVNLIQEWRGKAHFEVRIIDTGVGMSAEQQQCLFDPFTQADTSTSRRYGGTGLGLTLTKELLDLMGAQIKVSSEVGRGTQVQLQFVLPVATLAEMPPSPEPLLASCCVISPNELAAQRFHSLALEVHMIKAMVAEDVQALSINTYKAYIIMARDYDEKLASKLLYLIYAQNLDAMVVMVGYRFSHEKLSAKYADHTLTFLMNLQTRAEIRQALQIETQPEAHNCSSQNDIFVINSEQVEAKPPKVTEVVSDTLSLALLSEILELAKEGDALAVEKVEPLKSCKDLREAHMVELQALIDCLDSYEFDAAAKMAKTLLDDLTGL